MTEFYPDRGLRTIRAAVLPSGETDGTWKGTGVGLRCDSTKFIQSESISELPDDGFVAVVLATAKEHS